MSVKFRVTLWITLMMLVLAAVALTFVLILNSVSLSDNAGNRLIKVITHNVRATDADEENGKVELYEADLYERGVYTLCYNGDGELLLGAQPPEINITLPFKSSALQTCEINEKTYLVYDLFADGIWFRGIIDSEDESGLMKTIVILTVSILPFLIILASVGGWLIAGYAIKPIEKLTEAAEEISDGNDLTKRLSVRHGPKEIKKLAGTFDRMFERLESSFEAEKQFTSDASHELRTPVAVILAECKSAKRKSDLSEYEKSVNVIERNAVRISKMTEQLLSITRLEQGTSKYKLEYADLSEFTKAVCEDFDSISVKNITLEKNIESNIYLQFNMALMSRLIQNLIENAYKYGKEYGHITVLLTSDKGRARLTVTDDGTGISDEDIQNIFKRFWQADSSRGQEKGTGLGLSIVRQIAEFHGGEVSVQSVLGKGSTFTVDLPVKNDSSSKQFN